MFKQDKLDAREQKVELEVWMKSPWSFPLYEKQDLEIMHGLQRTSVKLRQYIANSKVEKGF